MVRKLLKVFTHFDRRARLHALGLIVFMLVVAVLEMIGIGLLFPFFEALSAPEKIETSRHLKAVHTFVNPESRTEFLIVLGSGLFVFYAAKNVLTVALYYLQGRFVFYKEAQFAKRLLSTYLRRPYAFHLQRNSSLLMHTVAVSVSQVFQLGVMPCLNVIMEAMVVIGVFVAVLYISPAAALTAAVALALPLIVFYVSLRKHLARYGQNIERFGAASKLWINQSLGAIKEAKILGREDFFEAAFGEARFGEARYRNLSTLAITLPRPLIETVTIGGLVVVMAVSLGESADLAGILPLLAVFGVAAFRLMPSLNRLAANFARIRVGEAAIDAVLSDLADAPDAPVAARHDEPAADAIGRIDLERVSYRYPTGSGAAVQDITLSIERGEAVAFVGPSGAGKTTLADLILGLFTPDTGRILVDGRNLSDDARGWQRHLGYVPQQIYLFDDTLRRNIALGLDDHQIDESRVLQAVRLAALDEFVRELRAGLDTVVGENGVRVSGGQRQRIGIARALYTDPYVLVLDEATSSLDRETEQAIMRAIESLRGRKTLIIIAHRLSTVCGCDRLFFLKKGRLADSGTFDELSRRNADFRRLPELDHLVEPRSESGVETA